MTKNFCLLCSMSQEPSIMWLLFMVQMCKMIICPGVFFNFKTVRGLKGQKMAQSEKISACRTLYFKNYISYDLHSWYICMYKRIISPGIFFLFFFLFKILLFGIIKGGVGAYKKWPKMTKNSVCLTPYLRNCTSYDCDFWCTCLKWWYLQQIFFIFQNFVFWGF